MYMDIQVEKPDQTKLDNLGVKSWPVWEKEVSTFDWHYDSTEECYLLAGKVTVTPAGGGKPVTFGKGDFVTFSRGLDCQWQITEPVRKHYNFK